MTYPTATRERPILFSAPMVRAILDGRKTMTRRIIKQAVDPALEQALAVFQCKADQSWIAWWGLTPEHGWQAATDECYPDGGGFPCPYGVDGDRLWVRETWGPRIEGGEPDPVQEYVKYRADFADDSPPADGMDWHTYETKWRPSIFMPRWASRLTLEITGVRVERLQDIDAEDVDAEGLPESQWSHVDGYRRTEFAVLWDQINGKGSWNANPWVWVVEFRRLP